MTDLIQPSILVNPCRAWCEQLEHTVPHRNLRMARCEKGPCFELLNPLCFMTTTILSECIRTLVSPLCLPFAWKSSPPYLWVTSAQELPGSTRTCGSNVNSPSYNKDGSSSPKFLNLNTWPPRRKSKRFIWRLNHAASLLLPMSMTKPRRLW